MRRSFEEEILDGGGQLPEVLARAHRALSLTHSLLGNHAAILRALRCDGPAVRRVLDIGCGHGGLLEKVRRQMGADVLGVDLRPPEGGVGEFPILQLDAVREVLPRADVAVCVCLVHHLRDEEFVEMIRNVGRTCRRFVILDLVRHRVPLALFSAVRAAVLAESECAGWAPVYPAGVHAGGVSRVDRAGGGGDEGAISDIRWRHSGSGKWRTFATDPERHRAGHNLPHPTCFQACHCSRPPRFDGGSVQSFVELPISVTLLL